MRLSIQHPFIQAHDAFLRKKEVEVFQRFGEPETLHAIAQLGRRLGHIVNGRVAKLGRRVCNDGLEHAPPGVAPVGGAGNAVHVPYRFYGFGAACTLVS